MSDPTFWIEARATGMLAFVLATLSVLAGLVLKSRPLGSAVKPATVTDLHRFLALLCVGATAIHGVALLLDSTVHIGVAGLLIPGLVSYRPLWVGLGVVAFELLVVVYVSFSQRKRIGTRTWRRLHWASYAVFAALVVHSVMSGTDTSRPWAAAVYAGSVGAVATATAWRALVPPVTAMRAPQRRVTSEPA